MVMSFLAAAAVAAHPLRMTGWTVFWNPDSISDFVQRAGQVDEVMPEWIGMDSEGAAFRRAYVAGKPKDDLIAAARAHKTAIYAMVSNSGEGSDTGFAAERVEKILASPEARKRHIEKVVQIIKEDGLDGADLDIESLKPADRDGFTTYVREMHAALKRARLKLGVTVHPKESEPGTWSGPQAQDWKAIGRSCDFFRVMTYDFSWSEGEPGPIAPTDWVERVMKYAVSQVPARKVYMGLCAYGYDWSTKPAQGFGWPQWAERDPLAIDCPLSSERILGKAHYAGAGSFRVKKALAQKLKLRGLAMWYFGSEDPAMWAGD